MTEITSTNNIFSDWGLPKDDKKESDELGQSAFLELMIAQLENQDPLSPAENTEFIAQLAQFSSVESLDKLNNNFDEFANNFAANQALQASTLVGRSVTIPTDTALLFPNDMVSGAVDIPMSVPEVNLNIYDETGTLVDKVKMPGRAGGEMVFRWDGMNMEVDGELLDWQSAHEEGVPPGKYRLEITSPIDGKQTQLDTSLSANVNSVTIGANGGLTLNLAGVGPVDMNDIKQFN